MFVLAFLKVAKRTRENSVRCNHTQPCHQGGLTCLRHSCGTVLAGSFTPSLNHSGSQILGISNPLLLLLIAHLSGDALQTSWRKSTKLNRRSDLFAFLVQVQDMAVLAPPIIRSISRSYSPVFLAIFLILLLCSSYRIGAPRQDSFDVLQGVSPQIPVANNAVPYFNAEFVSENHEFWQRFQDLLIATRPPVKALKPSQTARTLPHVAAGDLPDLIDLSFTEFRTIKRAHERFVSEIMSVSTPKLVYKPRSRGIVTTTGSAFQPVLLISLRMLRRSGNMLPVEVFVNSEEDVKTHICEVLLPALNAHCFDMSKVLGKDTKFLKDNRYFNKILALLFSSFDDLLFLDSDNLAVKDPMPLFTSEPFQSHGFVTWPDFWNATTSPCYYDIIGVPHNESIRGTVESGQLLISKHKHQSTLLMVAYYNYHGHDHYYPLLSQGGHGEGDKDTFLQAALAVGRPSYRVTKGLGMVGQWEDGKFKGVAMVQHDPIQDVKYQKWLSDHPQPIARTSSLASPPTMTPPPPAGLHEWTVSSDKRRPKPIFVHHHLPKLHPTRMFNEKAPTRDANRKLQRIWGSFKDTTTRFDGLDIEMYMWQELCTAACELEEAQAAGLKIPDSPPDHPSPQKKKTEKDDDDNDEDDDDDDDEDDDDDDDDQDENKGERSKNSKAKRADGSERWEDMAENYEGRPGRVCWRCRNYLKVVFHDDRARGTFYKKSGKKMGRKKVSSR